MKCDELKVYEDLDDYIGYDDTPPMMYEKSEVDAAIAELKAENRKLKRALYKACANWAKSERYTEATWHGDAHREELWANVQAKCRAKAEEHK